MSRWQCVSDGAEPDILEPGVNHIAELIDGQVGARL